MDKVRQSLLEVGNRFIDLALFLFAIFANLSTFFTLFRDYPEFINIFTWIRVLISLSLLVLYRIRARLSPIAKGILIFILLMVMYLFGTLTFGIFAPAKVFIVFGPAVILLLSNFRRAMFWTIGLTSIYFLVGLGFMTGKLEYGLNPLKIWNNYGQWMADLTIHLGLSAALIVIIHWFREELKKGAKEIETQNIVLERKKSEIQFLNNNLENILKERTKNLEAVNQTINDENELLKFQNEEIKNKNAELEKKKEQVKRLRQQLMVSERLSTLGMLTAGVSHEIKNPLNYLKGSAQVLRMRPQFSGNQNSNNGKLLDIIEGGVNRIKKVVDSLNQFDRQSNKPEEETDIVKILDNCLGVIQHQLNQNITLQLDKDVKSVIILANQDKLHQAITNVLQNAIESIDGKGTINVSIMANPDSVILEIMDTGKGIPAEHINLVTDPFFTTKSTQNHTGLGLHQVQQTMNELEGTLRISSDDNSGTVVRFIFPAPISLIKDAPAE